MRIEIDTNTDSKDAIRKVVRLLHELADEPYSNYAQSSPLPAPSQTAPSEGFFNLFGPVDSPAQSPQVISSPPPAQSSPPPSHQDGFFDIFKEDAKPAPSPSPSDGSDEDDRTIDEEYDDLARMIKKPAKPNVVKDSDMVKKKFQLPEDQISVIEY